MSGFRTYWQAQGHVATRMVLLGALLGGIAWLVTHNQPVHPMLRTAAVGPFPLAVRVDEHSHHAFVLSVARENPSAAEVSMIDTTTGRLLRATVVAQFPQALTVDKPTNHVFIANADNTVRILDARTGDVFRTISVRAASGATTMMVDGAQSAHVFMLGDMNVSMLDAQSGRVLRTIPIGLHPQGMAVDTHTGHVVVAGYADASSVGTVRVLDARTGSILRSINLNQSPSPGDMAVDEQSGRTFVIDRLIDTVSVLDAESGRVLRTVTIGSFPQALAVDAPTGRVFVTAYSGSGSGRVCMLDARSGRLLQKVVVGGSPVALAVAERTGRVVVAAVSPSVGAHTGSISILDGTVGRVVRTIPVLLAPRAMAVDQIRERTIVAGDAISGAEPRSDAWWWVPLGLRRWLPFLAQRPGAPATGAAATVLDTSRL
ncbi:MAG TPA: YncE family protein [Chloroflexota bacterium]|nr:YncE family protein [Chloroflexota bacterium]